MKRRASSLSLESIRRIACGFPGVEEGASYGTPAFRVRSKLLARMHESGDALVLRVQDADQREALIARDPKVFFVTDHYEGHPWVLARLSEARVRDVSEVFEEAWRRAAGKRLVAKLDD